MDYGCAHPLHSPHPYCLTPEYSEAAMHKALTNSGIDRKQIRLVVSGANGFQRLNEAEDAALRNVFLGQDFPSVIDAKQSIGETLGAAGVFSVIAAAEALHRQTLPAACTRRSDASLTASNTVATDADYALVNCYEFGGNINSIVVKRYEPAN